MNLNSTTDLWKSKRGEFARLSCFVLEMVDKAERFIIGLKMEVKGTLAILSPLDYAIVLWAPTSIDNYPSSESHVPLDLSPCHGRRGSSIRWALIFSDLTVCQGSHPQPKYKSNNLIITEVVVMINRCAITVDIIGGNV